MAAQMKKRVEATAPGNSAATPVSQAHVDHWLRLFSDRTDYIFWVMTLDPLQLAYANPAFERAWKTPVTSVLGDPESFFHTILAEDRELVRGVYASLQNRTSSRFDIRYRIVDGEGATRWIRQDGFAIEDGATKQRLLVGLATDETVQHRITSELRRRAEWFSLIVDQLPFVLWTTDRKLRFTSSMGSGLQALGLSPNRVVGLSLFEYFHTDDHENLHIRSHFSALSGETIKFESAWADRWYQTRLGPLRDENGNIIGVLGAAVDVTDLNQAAETLRESSRTYRMLIENNPDIAILVIDGKVRYVNEALTRLTGYSVEEVVSRSPIEFVVPEDRERVAERMQGIMAGASQGPTEYRARHKDGTLRTIEVRSHRIIYDGRPAMMTFSRDVTERRQAEDEARRHEEKLERLVLERTEKIQELERLRAEGEKLAATGRMAARVAHEINNPLAGIKSAFMLLRDSIPGDHPHYEFVGRIDREIERIAHITQLMYRLYRPGDPEWQLVPVEPCINDIVALIALAAKKKDVSVCVGQISCPPLRLPVGYMEQILYNLIQNAVDASSSGQSVTVEASCDGANVTISIIDEGRGIAPEFESRVFEPFFSTKAEGESSGLGLGLAVTRGLAEAAGGSLRFENRPSGGTIFFVTLPSENEEGTGNARHT
jgi:hypothetical protein